MANKYGKYFDSTENKYSQYFGGDREIVPVNKPDVAENKTTLSEDIGDVARLGMQGISDIGGAVGYGLEKTGLAPKFGRELQKSNTRVQEKIGGHLTPAMQEAQRQPLLTEDNSLNPEFGLRSLAANVVPSIPGTLAMGVMGAPLANLATKGASALNLGSKVARISTPVGPIAQGVEKGIERTIGSGLGFGASEGIFSGAQNAAQWGEEQRAKSIDEFAKHPAWQQALADNGGNPELAKESLINQGQSDIFRNTALTTGGISALTGGGMYGVLRNAKAPVRDGFWKATAKSVGSEAGQEAPQSGMEQLYTNEATRDYVDPNQSLTEGTLNATATGGVVGGVMGLAGGAGNLGPLTKAANKTNEVDLLRQDSASRVPAEEQALGNQEYTTDTQNRTNDAQGFTPPTPEQFTDTPYNTEVYTPEIIQKAQMLGDVGPDILEEAAVRKLTNEQLNTVLDDFIAKARTPNDQSREPGNVPGTPEPTARERERADAASLDAARVGTEPTPNADAVGRGPLDLQTAGRNQGEAGERPSVQGQLEEPGAMAGNRGEEGYPTGASDQQQTSALPEGSDQRPATADTVQPRIGQGKEVLGREFVATHTDQDGDRYQHLGGDEYRFEGDGQTYNFNEGELTPLEQTNGLQEKQKTAEEISQTKEGKPPIEPDFDAPKSEWDKYNKDYDTYYGKEDLTPRAANGKSIEQQKKDSEQEREAYRKTAENKLPVAVKRGISDSIITRIKKDNNEYVDGGSFGTQAKDTEALNKFKKRANKEQLGYLKAFEEVETDRLIKEYRQNAQQTNPPSLTAQPNEPESTLGQANQPDLAVGTLSATQNAAKPTEQQQKQITTATKQETFSEPQSQAKAAPEKAATGTQDPILTQKKNSYVNQEIKARGIKKGSPGYQQAVDGIKGEYEGNFNRALANLPFDEFKAHPVNAEVSEGAIKQSYDALRDEYGVTDETTNQVTQEPSKDVLRQEKAKSETGNVQESRKENNLPGLTEAQSAAVRELPKATVGKIRTEANKAITNDSEKITPQQAKEIQRALKEETNRRGNQTSDELVAQDSAKRSEVSGEEEVSYHPAIVSMANDLVEDGGIAIDKNGRRNPSLNPEWYKDNAFVVKSVDGKKELSKSPSVKAIKKAVIDYESGKPLKKSQVRILEALSDIASYEETLAKEQFNAEQEDFARELNALIISGDKAGIREYIQDAINRGDITTYEDIEAWQEDINDIIEQRSQSSDSVSQEPLLENYTEKDVAERRNAEKQQQQREKDDEIKAEQKRKADNEVDTLVDEMLGNIGNEDVFNPLAQKPTKAEPKARNINESALKEADNKRISEKEQAWIDKLRKNAKGTMRNIGGKSLAPVASDYVEQIIAKRRRLTDDELSAIANKHGIKEDFVKEFSTNAGFGFDSVMFAAERGDEGAKAFVRNKPKAKEQGGDKAQTDEGKSLYSRNETTKNAYEKRIDELFNGAKPKQQSGATILDSSDLLGLLGFGREKMTLAEGKVLKSQEVHKMTPDLWKKIPEWLDNPLAVFDSDTVEGRLVFVAPEKLGNDPILMIVEPNVQEGRATVNLLVNSYDADIQRIPVRRWVNQEKLRYIDNKKSRDVSAASWLRLPTREQQNKPGSRVKILTERNLVKYRESIGAKKSTGSNRGITVTQAKALLPKRVNRLLENKTLEIVQSVKDLPKPILNAINEDNAASGELPPIEGFNFSYEDKYHIYLIADNLSNDSFDSVLKHELYHYARVADPKLKEQLNKLDTRLQRRFDLAANGKATPIENQAYQRAIKAGTPEKYQLEEFQAYLISEHNRNPQSLTGVIKKWVQDLLAVIRSAMIRNGMMPKQITAADLNALAMYGARFDSIQKSGKNTLMSFVGEKSETADKRSLDSAKHRLANGENSELIRQETGWFKGVDGKWRYEINDRDAKLKKPFPNKGQLWGDVFESVFKRNIDTGKVGITVGDLLEHPSLFSAYPSISELSISTQKQQGASYKKASAIGPEVIKISEDEPMYKVLSTLLHEIQHAIQTVEGFAEGGSSSQNTTEINITDGLMGAYEDLMSIVIATDGDIENAPSLDDMRFESGSESIVDWIHNLMDSEKLNEEVPYEDGMEWGTKFEIAADNFMHEFDKASITPEQQYFRSAGEVEARNVQKRLNMSDQERKSNSPKSTQDVSEDKIIVEFNGDVMENAPLPENAKSSSVKYSREQGESEDPNIELNRRIREQHKTISDKVKTFLKRELAPGGLLPKKVFDLKISRDSEMNAVELDTHNIVAGLDRAVKAEWNSSYIDLPENQQKLIEERLRGKEVNLPESIKDRVDAMRLYIDKLSLRYAQTLFDEAKELAENDKTEAAAAKVALLNTIAGNVGEYVNRSYRAFDDANWPKKVPDDVLNNAREYFVNKLKAKGVDNPTGRAQIIINDILKSGTAYDTFEQYIKESKLGAKDLSILKQRKEIAPEVRALLGEYTDARVNFVKSATKMSRLVFNDDFLKQVKTIGLGDSGFLFTEETRPADEHTVKIAADSNSAYAPLNGLYTYPEVNQAFIDALGRENMESWYRMIVQANGMVKYGKTVLSPTTSLRNWMSAFFFSMANSHFDMSHMKESIESFQTYFDKTDVRLGYLRKLKKLGVIYDTPYAGEMMALLADSKFESTLMGNPKSKADRAKLKVKDWMDIATKFYQFGDDFWKIIGFENEKRILMKYRNMTETEAEVEAAKRIRDTYPTYSMVGRMTQKLRRFPLAGTFVSFPAEILRTSFNMIKYAKEDMAFNKELGRRRIAGLAMVSAMSFAAQAMMKTIIGMDDDEEEALRDLAPPWSKNSNILPFGRDEHGALRYMDLSFLDPYNYWKRPLVAIMRDEPVDEKIYEAGRELLAPFFGRDIAFGAIADIWQNKKESGGRVFNPNDSTFNIAVDMANHLRKALQPGAVSNMERMADAITGHKSSSGRTQKVSDELAALFGFRVSTLDPKVALYYRSFEFQDKLRDATKILSDAARNPNKVSQSSLKSAYERARQTRTEAFKDMNELVNAAKKSGLSNGKIMQLLRLNQISKKDIRSILRGEEPKWRPSRQFLQSSIKRSDDFFDSQTKDSFKRRRDFVLSN